MDTYHPPSPPSGAPAIIPGNATPRVPATIADVLHRRKYRIDGWSAVKVAAFITALGESGSVTRAAAYVRMSTASCYSLRNHPEGAAFAEAWDDAVGARYEMLADIALDRARDGVEVARWYKGEQVGFDRVFNDRLLMFMLDKCDPKRGATALVRAGARTGADAGAVPALAGPGAMAVLEGPGGGGGDPAEEPDPVAELAAALAEELAAEGALTPEEEAETDAYIIDIAARIATGTAAEAEITARLDAIIHPRR